MRALLQAELHSQLFCALRLPGGARHALFVRCPATPDASAERIACTRLNSTRPSGVALPRRWPQEDPPKPSEPDVYIESSKRFTAYVAQSGGFLIDDFSVARMAKALSEVGPPRWPRKHKRRAWPLTLPCVWAAKAELPVLAWFAFPQALDAEGVEYEDEHFYTAGYDPPFRLQGRHNEVWFVASEDEDSATVAEQ